MFKPHAKVPKSGSIDICFVTKVDLSEWITYLKDYNIKIKSGPTRKIGDIGIIDSIYIRNPDMNLIEISNRV